MLSFRCICQECKQKLIAILCTVTSIKGIPPNMWACTFVLIVCVYVFICACVYIEIKSPHNLPKKKKRNLSRVVITLKVNLNTKIGN